MKIRLKSIIFSSLYACGFLAGCSSSKEASTEPEEPVISEKLVPEVDDEELEVVSAPVAKKAATKMISKTEAPAPPQGAKTTKKKEASANGYAGYESGSHLYVKASSLNVRVGPGKKNKVSNRLEYGTKVTVWANKGKWIKIGESEWVYRNGLTPQYLYSNKSH